MSGFTSNDKSAVKTITVKKFALIARLKENLDKHEREFKLAWEKYKEVRHTAIRKIGNWALEMDPDNKDHRGCLLDMWHDFTSLPIPRNHNKDYHQAISLMEWDEGSTVQLSIQDFEYFINDNWDWRGAFVNTMSNYTH